LPIDSQYRLRGPSEKSDGPCRLIADHTRPSSNKILTPYKMSAHTLYDAIPNVYDIHTLFRLAEAGYWSAFNSYLARENVIKPNTLTPERITELIRRCVGADRQFVCCLCEKQCTGYGNNPAPLVVLAEGDDRRCCNKCNEERVIPERIRDATRQLAIIQKN
jgi:hypothetical protein